MYQVYEVSLDFDTGAIGVVTRKVIGSKSLKIIGLGSNLAQLFSIS